MPAQKKAARKENGDAPDSPPSIEELIARIDGIVERLEDETAPLDVAIRDFEDGMALTKQAQLLLQDAEQRVQVLLAEEPEAETPEDCDDADDDA
jgi:exodeoxyribonuclease VII small subunit